MYFIEYSTQLLDQIPIKYILNHVETFQKGEAYKAIYSDMLAVSANLFPELFEVSSFLIQEGKDMDMLWDMETKKRYMIYTLFSANTIKTSRVLEKKTRRKLISDN